MAPYLVPIYDQQQGQSWIISEEDFLGFLLGSDENQLGLELEAILQNSVFIRPERVALARLRKSRKVVDVTSVDFHTGLHGECWA